MAAPVPFTISGTATFSVTPKLTIDWSTATADAQWNGWRVYRKNVTDTAWVLQFSTTTVATRTYDDWLAPSTEPCEYAVTQTTTVGTESALVTSGTILVSNDKYWLVHPTLPSMNFKFFSVTSDDYEDEVEVAAVNLIGRGRRVEHGDSFGIKGALSAQLTDQVGSTARQQVKAIKALRDIEADMYLRTPFGDVWHVHPSALSVSRIAGVGQREFCTVDLEYTEITA